MPVRTPSTPDWFHQTLGGVANVSRNLDNFVSVVRKKLLKKAMIATGEPLKSAMQTGITRRRTGALSDSIDFKIKIDSDGKFARMYVGPKRGIKIPVRMIGRGANKGMLLVAIPTRYAHLVEFGHRVVVGGKEVGQVAPLPFMRNAWALAGGEKALATFARALEEGIAAEPLVVAS